MVEVRPLLEWRPLVLASDVEFAEQLINGVPADFRRQDPCSDLGPLRIARFFIELLIAGEAGITFACLTVFTGDDDGLDQAAVVFDGPLQILDLRVFPIAQPVEA
jgi:hypothetical protein